MVFKLPQNFSLYGHEFQVVFNQNAKDSDEAYGYYSPHDNLIEIMPRDSNGDKLPQSWLEQVFFHELVHAILYHMDEKRLGDDERFVDLFANLLHQAIISMKGELNENNPNSSKTEGPLNILSAP